jgi:hypothetical protein
MPPFDEGWSVRREISEARYLPLPDAPDVAAIEQVPSASPRAATTEYSHCVRDRIY